MARSESVYDLVAMNLGLDTYEAGNVQQWLMRYWRYAGPLNGVLGPDSWMAFQGCLKARWSYTGAINGEVRSDTVSALQRMLAARRGYTGPIDGVPGTATQAAFKRFASGDGPTAADC
ncbi:peptidoglycan-binding protein [Streptomyces olivaceoviridis]|uniref:peptidoglycan-binding domain-containing protein n=1 Tax=Streptomyces olivaceoviridis TaxID=1921 RepID=UPI00369D4AAD